MDKSNFETYEYLPTSNTSEAGNEQFFVMQENGSFLISRHAVQYEVQAHNAKDPLAMENMQECTVYDVTPQQFLVDVNNSSELITVQDQYILPESENTSYANNYLLQPGTAAAAETMEEGVAIEFEPAESQVNIDAVAEDKLSNNCTEITLTDEQYQMLEQKGWILLEISDKIFVLDTLGLHDVTTNDKLIQKLKSESQCSARPEVDNGTLIENDGIESVETQGAVDFVIDNKIAIGQDTSAVNSSLLINNNEGKQNATHGNIYNSGGIELPKASSETKTEVIDSVKDGNTGVVVIENESIRRVGNTLKVKTKLSLKDFPDKIALGRTKAGKNLIAKVIKQAINKERKIDTNGGKPEDNSQTVFNKTLAVQRDNNSILNDSEFCLFLKQCFQNKTVKCCAEDVVSADAIVLQLLQIPDFKSSVIDSNLIITKVTKFGKALVKLPDKSLSAVVTGRVSLIAGTWRFVHLPHMLQEMVTDTESRLSKPGNKSLLKKEYYDIIHVQISEDRQSPTDVGQVSVTVNKKTIPLNFITNIQSYLPKTIYACSACASVFNTELDLKDHQANSCLEQDGMLTIDMEQQPTPGDYCVIDNSNTKTYACMQCAAQFTRLATCKNHLKTHCSSTIHDTDENVQPESNKSGGKGVYKCNMCAGTYFHPSTLSKHIVTRHIKIKN